MVTQFKEKSAPRVEPVECFAVKGCASWRVAERAVGDFEELGGARTNTTGFLEGGLQLHSLRRSDNLFKIHALVRYGHAVTRAARSFRITQDPVGQDSC
jgi:hypothetical protein